MLHFIVDTTFGISRNYAKKHHVKMVNLKLILDDVITDEGFPEEWDEFYDRFEHSKNFPTTSQPNPQDFLTAIDEVYAQDPSAEIIVLTIASGLSGTANSARLAVSAYPDKKIAAIDSMSASLCQNLMLDELVQAAESGNTFEEVCELAESLKERLAIYFVPDSMKYLEKGGRIGKLGAILASAIQIKPLFEFKNNVISVAKKVLGMGAAINEMVRKAATNFKRIVVVYIHNNKHVPAILEKIAKHMGLHDVEIRPVDPVFGVHVGIGAVGIACLSNA